MTQILYSRNVVFNEDEVGMVFLDEENSRTLLHTLELESPKLNIIEELIEMYMWYLYPTIDSQPPL